MHLASCPADLRRFDRDFVLSRPWHAICSLDSWEVVMFRNSILAGFMVLAFTAMVYVGCSTSSDGGGGDEPKR